MKQLLSLFIGFVIIPVGYMCIFSGINYILSLLPGFGTYISIQQSAIWILWGAFIALNVVMWFLYDPIVEDWNES